MEIHYHHIQSDSSVYDTGYDTKGFPKKIITSQMVNDHNCKSTLRILPVQKLSIGLNNSIVEMSKSVPRKTTQVFSHILFSLVPVFIWL